MKIRRVMIASPKSGSGKTTITCAILQALKNAGMQAVSCKCGPDYIDPMFHEQVLGIPSGNLDTFFTDAEETKKLFVNSIREKDFAVLEGVMGIYDGLGGVREEGSSYHLAEVTDTPIIFVVDAKGMGRSVIALLAGFLAYDKAHLIRGVILNRISKGYFEIIKPWIENELNLAVIGFFPERRDIYIESRHLGLKVPDELESIKQKLQKLSDEFVKTVSMDKIVRIAEAAGALECKEKKRETGLHVKAKPVIAAARDEAFCFYYAENIRLLEEYGAEIRYFSPLHDDRLPDHCGALLLGGGYPELYAGKLSENRKMRLAVREAVKGGMPVTAECGGFMYLHTSITDKEGVSYAMAGVLPGTCFYTGKLVRFGYVEIREKRNYFLAEGEAIKGHEFHYYESTDNGKDALAVKPVTGKAYSCIMEGENYWLGFPHLYYPSNPLFAKRFAEKAGLFCDALQKR